MPPHGGFAIGLGQTLVRIENPERQRGAVWAEYAVSFGFEEVAEVHI